MQYAVLGAGQMGRAAVYDLSRQDSTTAVTVFDIDLNRAQSVADTYGHGKTRALSLDITQLANNPLQGFDAAISAISYQHNPMLTQFAIDAQCHFFDLGGNNDVVAEQFQLHNTANAAGVVIIPDCGLAPGMVSILAANLIEQCDTVESVKIRVGGLPQQPKPPLNYQLVFSSEGLINEYWEPVLIVNDGTIESVPPLSAVESLNFDDVGELEAFYTSGGTSTLPQTYQDQVKFLDYKTIRYPGHCAMIKPMLELGFASRDSINVDGTDVQPRSVLKAVLERALSSEAPDMVLLRVDCIGQRDGKTVTLRHEIVDRKDEATGLTAMMRTTAFPIAIIAQMATAGHIEQRGVLRQELAINSMQFIKELKQRNILIKTEEL